MIVIVVVLFLLMGIVISMILFMIDEIGFIFGVMFDGSVFFSVVRCLVIICCV